MTHSDAAGWSYSYLTGSLDMPSTWSYLTASTDRTTATPSGRAASRQPQNAQLVDKRTHQGGSADRGQQWLGGNSFPCRRQPSPARGSTARQARDANAAPTLLHKSHTEHDVTCCLGST